MAHLRLSDNRSSPLLNLVVRYRARAVLGQLLRACADPWGQDGQGLSAISLAVREWPEVLPRLLKAGGQREAHHWEVLMQQVLHEGRVADVSRVWESGELSWRENAKKDPLIAMPWWHHAAQASYGTRARLQALLRLGLGKDVSASSAVLAQAFIDERLDVLRWAWTTWPSDPMNMPSEHLAVVVHAYGHPRMLDEVSPLWRRQWGQCSLERLFHEILRTSASAGWDVGAILPVIRRHSTGSWRSLSASAGFPWPSLLFSMAAHGTRATKSSTRVQTFSELVKSGDDPRAVTQDGNNLLHVLLKKRSSRPCSTLLTWAARQGVSWWTPNTQGITPLDLLRPVDPARAARLERQRLNVAMTGVEKEGNSRSRL